MHDQMIDALHADSVAAHAVLDAAGFPAADDTGMPLSVAGRLRSCAPPLLLGLLVRRDASTLRNAATIVGAYADEIAQDDALFADLDEQLEREWSRWARLADQLSDIASYIDRQWLCRRVELLAQAARTHLAARSEASAIDLDQRLCDLAEHLTDRPCTDRATAILVLLGYQP